MHAFNYKGSTITATDDGAYRVDRHYATIGTYATAAAAKACASRCHRAMVREFNAESARARAIPECRDIVATAAELARSIASRAACCGIAARLQIYAAHHSLIVTLESDPSDRGDLQMVGTIGADVAYSDYFARIYAMARNAPIYA
jgi:hypothetical protein